MGKNKYYCRIDGVIYNLKKIQDIIDENPENPDMVRIYLSLVEDYHFPASGFLLDEVIKFNNNEIPADYNEALEKLRAHNRKKWENKLSCPRCGSTNIIKPVFSEYEYKCKNCKHKFTRCPKCGSTNVRVTELADAVTSWHGSDNRCNHCNYFWRK